METQLVDARENDITLEKVYPLFLKVLPAAISLNERTREAEVDYVYIVFSEDVIFSWLDILVNFYSVIEHQVIKFEIIEDVAAIVNLLQDVQ